MLSVKYSCLFKPILSFGSRMKRTCNMNVITKKAVPSKEYLLLKTA